MSNIFAEIEVAGFRATCPNCRFDIPTPDGTYVWTTALIGMVRDVKCPNCKTIMAVSMELERLADAVMEIVNILEEVKSLK